MSVRCASSRARWPTAFSAATGREKSDSHAFPVRPVNRGLSPSDRRGLSPSEEKGTVPPPKRGLSPVHASQSIRIRGPPGGPGAGDMFPLDFGDTYVCVPLGPPRSTRFRLRVLRASPFSVFSTRKREEPRRNANSALAEPLHDKAADRFGAGGEIGFVAAPGVELPEQLRLEARADQLAALRRARFTGFPVNRCCVRHAKLLTQKASREEASTSPRL